MQTYRVVISRRAARDIDSISDQTIDRWDKQQARKYITTIRLDIESLNRSPLRYPRHRANSFGLRCMRSGHHLVFFNVDEGAVYIVRVLHERMDVEARLG